jgi:RNA polymerase sigma factor (sigma-70 family)
LLAVTADGGDERATPDASTTAVELTLLVEREADGLRRLAYARIGSWAAAEDVVQDVLTDAHRRWDTLRGYDDPLAWARRAVLNRSASFHRRRGRERRAMSRLAGRADVTPVDEPRLDDEALWAAIRTLSDRQADVVLLLWFEDLPAAQVALILGCGEDTVRTHWRRARAHLARALGEPEEDRR